MQLFSEEFMERAMKKTAYLDGMEAGMELGMMQGSFRLVNKGRISLEEAQMPVAVFQARMAEYAPEISRTR